MFFSIVVQVVVITLGVVTMAVGWGWTVTGAFLFGGAVALTNSGLLVWRWHRGRSNYHCDGERHLESFRRSAKERFLVVVLLMAAGLAALELAPLHLMMGFIVGQLAWVIAAAIQKTD